MWFCITVKLPEGTAIQWNMNHDKWGFKFKTTKLAHTRTGAGDDFANEKKGISLGHVIMWVFKRALVGWFHGKSQSFIQLWPWLPVITGYFYGIIHSINGVFLVLITNTLAITVDDDSGYHMVPWQNGNLCPEMGRLTEWDHGMDCCGVLGNAWCMVKCFVIGFQKSLVITRFIVIYSTIIMSFPGKEIRSQIL